MCSSSLLLLVVALLNFSVFTEQLQYVNDDPIKVSQLGESARPTSGIESCMTSNDGGFNARVYSVKTSDDSEFIRHFVNEDDAQCFLDGEGKHMGSDLDFKTCAEKTATERYNSFTYNAGVCTAYRTWRPKELSTCYPGATGVPYYVVDDPLSEFMRYTTRDVTVNFVNRDDTSVDLELEMYDPCHQESLIASYELEFKGSVVDTVTHLPNDMQSYTLNHNELCDDDLEIVVRLINIHGERIGDPFVESIPNVDVFQRKYLSTGNCVIINEEGGDYDESLSFCQGLGLTMFSETNDGDFVAYAAAMTNAITTSSDNTDEDHFVYIRKESGNWVWKGDDVPQPDQATDPDAWSSDSENNDCCRSDEGDDFLLKSKNCGGTMPQIVCHKILT